MTIAHHPAPESLMCCSAGSMPESFAAVMASHIAMCPACRRELALMEQIGSVLFESVAPAPIAGGDALSGKSSAETEDNPQPTAKPVGDVPAPLVKHVGTSLDAVSWKHIAPGVWQHQIELSKGARGTLRLIKVAPGIVLPDHGHEGSELTLVLKGSLSDANGHYRVGDVSDVGEDVEHIPVADPKEGCICLTANEGKVRFKNPLLRLYQFFIGI